MSQIIHGSFCQCLTVAYLYPRRFETTITATTPTVIDATLPPKGSRDGPDMDPAAGIAKSSN